MNRRLVPVLISLCLLSTSSAHAITGAHLWSKRFGSTGTDLARSVAVDASGNVIVTGGFSGTIDFGGGPLVSAGQTDVFLVKYSPAGRHLWSKSFGGTDYDYGHSVCVDGSGNILLTGYFSGTLVNLGGAAQYSSNGNSADLFICKYDPNGTGVWGERFGGSLPDFGWSVATDPSGNVYVLGQFQGTGDFTPPLPTLSSTASSVDVFLQKLDGFMQNQWVKKLGGSQDDVGYGLAVDASGNVIVTGQFKATGIFGGTNLVSAGGNDIFLAKYDTAGTHLWSQRFGSTFDDVGHSVAVDGSGNIFTAGTFIGTVNFGGGNLVAEPAGDIFFAKYDAGGLHQWSKVFGGSGQPDYGRSVSTDASGVLLAGGFWGSVNFGGGTLAANNGDAFLAHYTSAGVHQWSRKLGASGTGDIAYGAATDFAGNTVAAGYVYNSSPVDFGGGLLLGSTLADVFVVKYSPLAAEPAITSIKDIGNDQGRKVKVRFSRSGVDDANASAPVNRYVVFRKDASPPAVTSTSGALLDAGWTQVGSIDAFGTSSYGIDVPTIGDSTIALGQYRSTFFVRGATAVPSQYFDSPPDSGYSVDNLAPGIPSNFVYTAGNLSWDESKAEDFDYFTVYGSSTSSFGSATVVNYSVAPGLNVTSSPYAYYFVTATDFSGNEGKPAVVHVTSGVGGTPQSYVLSVSNYPNPFNPRTTVSYTVPSRGHVSVRVFDAHGAFVATLFDGERSVGPYSVGWDGRAKSGDAVASGIYFARIEHNGVTRTKKMALLK